MRPLLAIYQPVSIYQPDRRGGVFKMPPSPLRLQVSARKQGDARIRAGFAEDIKSKGKDSVWDAAARIPITTGREEDVRPRSLDEEPSGTGIPSGGRRLIE
jgi:hypothetical protein